MGLPAQQAECGVGVDTVGQHQHALACSCVLGDLGVDGLPVLVLQGRGEIDIEAVGADHHAGVVYEPFGYHHYVVRLAVGVDDAVARAEGLPFPARSSDYG